SRSSRPRARLRDRRPPCQPAPLPRRSMDEVTMKNLEDRLAIHDLFVRYATALDDGEVETVVACFTADAALESPAIGRIRGEGAIRAFAERFAAWRAAGAQFRHLITNLAVDIDAGGEWAG